MNDYERVSKLIDDYGERIEEDEGFLDLSLVFWDPEVRLYRHLTGEIEFQLYGRDVRPKSYLLTKEDVLYKSLNGRISKANTDDRFWLMYYLDDLVKEEDYEW